MECQKDPLFECRLLSLSPSCSLNCRLSETALPEVTGTHEAALSHLENLSHDTDAASVYSPGAPLPMKGFSTQTPPYLTSELLRKQGPESTLQLRPE